MGGEGGDGARSLGFVCLWGKFRRKGLEQGVWGCVGIRRNEEP